MVNEKMNYNVKISKLASNSFFMKGKTKEDQLTCAINLYDQMIHWYGEFLQTENGRNCIAEFDRILPGYVWMSDVEKLDFYLWSIRD